MTRVIHANRLNAIMFVVKWLISSTIRFRRRRTPSSNWFSSYPMFPWAMFYVSISIPRHWPTKRSSAIITSHWLPKSCSKPISVYELFTSPNKCWSMATILSDWAPLRIWTISAWKWHISIRWDRGNRNDRLIFVSPPCRSSTAVQTMFVLIMWRSFGRMKPWKANGTMGKFFCIWSVNQFWKSRQRHRVRERRSMVIVNVLRNGVIMFTFLNLSIVRRMPIANVEMIKIWRMSWMAKYRRQRRRPPRLFLQSLFEHIHWLAIQRLGMFAVIPFTVIFPVSLRKVIITSNFVLGFGTVHWSKIISTTTVESISNRMRSFT